ncbi:hypothetical protein [Ectobacillus panaciterrae]|nr:hypothetical protein [Ectobacillus panaciterrae]
MKKVEVAITEQILHKAGQLFASDGKGFEKLTEGYQNLIYAFENKTVF